MTPVRASRRPRAAGRDGLLWGAEEFLTVAGFLVDAGRDSRRARRDLPASPAADLVVLDEAFGPEGGPDGGPAPPLRSRAGGASRSWSSFRRARSHLEECLVAGINDFLLAPFPEGELLDKARRLTEVAARREVNTIVRVHEVREAGVTVHGKTLNVSVNGLLAEVDAPS